jgi:hypothetical protein
MGPTTTGALATAVAIATVATRSPVHGGTASILARGGPWREGGCGHASPLRGISTAVSSSHSFPPFPPPLARHLRPRSAATRRLTLAIPADEGEDAPRSGALEGEGIFGRTGRSWCKLGSTCAGPERQLGLPKSAIEGRCSSSGPPRPVLVSSIDIEAHGWRIGLPRSSRCSASREASGDEAWFEKACVHQFGHGEVVAGSAGGGDASTNSSQPEGMSETVSSSENRSPRRPRSPLEQATEVANLRAPRLWNPVQSLRGLSPAEVDAANSLLKFSYHTAFLSEMVLELRTIR